MKRTTRIVRSVAAYTVEEPLRRALDRFELLTDLCERQAFVVGHGYSEGFGSGAWSALADLSREGAHDARGALDALPADALNLASSRVSKRDERI